MKDKLTCKKCLIKDICLVSNSPFIDIITNREKVWPCTVCIRENDCYESCNSIDCKFELKGGAYQHGN